MTLLTLTRTPEVPRYRATAQVFADPRSRELLAHLEKISPSEASVLVIGETGTGKELIARHIHALSHRHAGPFVAVNCGAFAESLVEAELFGHEKGAFTGALGARAGWFEEANGGTLFLDEIGDLPLPVQVKLLRVLQEREVVRLGSRRSIPLDVRIIAATNVPLERAVAAGTFREDLWYRLNVVNLPLLPLRQRRGDILPLARHFLHAYAQAPVSLSPAAEQRLLEHPWPGNIRELENTLQHALLLKPQGVLDAGDLVFVQRPALATSPTRSAEPAPTDSLLTEAFTQLFEEQPDGLHERVEDALVRAAYRFCHRNQVHTARLLGLSRNVTRAHLIRIGELVVNHRRPIAQRPEREVQFSI
ncbi:sigma-54 interaction domain-containing protein [Pseudomonas oryzihabitans]|uniref:DNA-binding NtrC family response regulator n=1 Tax=Pseudomonas oryzihabitans TaxID=47885 RepID=A0AAJ2BGS8_9PSED|nr:sigma-54 dependent transcriptional regulator [Pseudomonas psychrotolerans]MDR6232547.1 DNA-binding NtrC family response regulator [Pseudomonas psychrotolerans]MDR6358523.1 DNA-binding NtrC family response regulator [Pseudomonas psychrotolerans]